MNINVLIYSRPRSVQKNKLFNKNKLYYPKTINSFFKYLCHFMEGKVALIFLKKVTLNSDRLI